MTRRNRNSIKKERIIMLASSLFVLTALTVTGIYVKQSNRVEKDDYVVDFGALEGSGTDLAANRMPDGDLDTLFAEVGTDDLDYDPSFQEANSLHVKNAETSLGAKKGGKTDQNSQKKTDTQATERESDRGLNQKTGTETPKKDDPVDKSALDKSDAEKQADAGMFDETADAVMSGQVQAATIPTTVQPDLNFGDKDSLVWPIVGDVLINYSMDKTIYFPTLDQYKYNPAIVIAAPQGESISAAANGRVSAVRYDPGTGNTVVMDLGNGYELTYGQLENITVSEGSYVSVGDGIGTVAAPTKYYSLEGANVYFKLTKDGVPVNPMSKLQ